MRHDSRILITGAGGLAGSAVVKHFQDRGFEHVIPFTRDTVDLTNTDETMKAFYRNEPEYVFHAAALVYGLQGNIDNQGKSIFFNTLINTNVVHASKIAGVKKIVAMGSNCTYPSPPVLPYREDNIFDGRPDPGEAAYGHAKRHLLAMLEAYHDSYGMDYAYLVSGNLYGPRDTFDPINGHVLPSLVHKFYEASRNEMDLVRLWGNGSTTRDFLYSEDLADLVSFAMGHPDFKGAVNTGSGQSVSIDYVAKRLSSISGVDFSRVIYDNSKPTGRPTCYADLSKLRALGWNAPTRFADGLEATYKWYAQSREKRLNFVPYGTVPA